MGLFQSGSNRDACREDNTKKNMYWFVNFPVAFLSFNPSKHNYTALTKMYQKCPFYTKTCLEMYPEVVGEERPFGHDLMGIGDRLEKVQKNICRS
jgi:hypothetical protein